MKRKDRFLPLADLRSMAEAIGKGSAVSAVVVRDKDGKAFMQTSGPRAEIEELLREALEAFLLGQHEPPDHEDKIATPPKPQLVRARPKPPDPPIAFEKPRLILP